MRNIIDTMNKIWYEVPLDFQYYHNMKHDFDNIKDSVPYTAPEAMGTRWAQIAESLESYLGEPDQEWKKKIAAIFGDKDG